MTSQAAPWGELNLGSNIVYNPSGALIVQGEEQVFLERGKEDFQLLLTIDVYDQGGAHVAKLRRNAWAFNEQDRYDVTTNPRSLRLVERATGATVIEANVLDRDRIAVPNGGLYTHLGDLIEITPSYLRVRGFTLARNSFDCGGRAIRIDQGGLGIG